LSGPFEERKSGRLSAIFALISASESPNSQNGLDFSVYLGSLTRETAFNGEALDAPWAGMTIMGMLMRRGLASTTLLVGGCFGLLALMQPALAVDCQKDFANLMQPRQKLIEQINTFSKKKTTPQTACTAFTKLGASDNKLIAWVKLNKDWCHIPDDFAKNLEAQSEQASKVRGQACGMAAKQSKMMEQMKVQQRREAQGGPSGLPGSGVRLPKGAL
jgi:hypothetical protein